MKDSEGYLYFISREDQLIKTSGYRVSPSEIEEVALNISGVVEAAALGLPHPDIGQAIALVVSLNTPPHGDHSTREELMRQCRHELPAFMVPKAIFVVDSLPLNPNGKIDRTSLASQHKNTFLEPDR